MARKLSNTVSDLYAGMRLDSYLFEAGLYPTRSKAVKQIEAGKVFLNGKEPTKKDIVNETKTNNAIDDRNERSAWRMRFHVGLHYLVANTPKHDHHPEQEIVASCFA